jgi:hypothetical protein
MGSLRGSVLVAIAIALLCAPAWAQGNGPDPDLPSSASLQPINPWQLEVAPYGWALNVQGDLTIEGIDSSINLTIVDILNFANKVIAFEGLIEARKGRFSIFSLTDYFNTEFSDDIAEHFQPRKKRLSIDVDTHIALDLELIFAEFGATFELLKQRYGDGQSDAFAALDLVAGGRYNSIKSETDILLEVGATFTPKFIPVTISRNAQFVGTVKVDEDWIDPFIGLRLRMQSANGYRFFARGDVGGFGVSSDLVWQVMGGLSGECRCNENLSWMLGYRALDTTYETGTGRDLFELDALIHGPIIGGAYRF